MLFLKRLAHAWTAAANESHVTPTGQAREAVRLGRLVGLLEAARAGHGLEPHAMNRVMPADATALRQALADGPDALAQLQRELIAQFERLGRDPP